MKIHQQKKPRMRLNFDFRVNSGNVCYDKYTIYLILT